MPTTTTTLGRLELVNPDLGYDGGAGLQTVEETLRTKISDAITSRYYASSAVADSTTTEYRHNFGIALDEFAVLIYTGSHPNLTRVDDPAGAGWTIAAKVGEEKETIEVTTPSTGGPHTYAVFAIHNGAGDFTGDVTVGGTLGVDSITDLAGTGAPNFPNGLTKGRVDFAVFTLSADISVVDSSNTAYSNLQFAYGDSSITTNGASITVPSTGYWKISVNIDHVGSFNRARLFDAGSMMTDAGLNGIEIFDTRPGGGLTNFTGTGTFICKADTNFAFSPTYFIDTTAATVIESDNSWINVEKISELT